MKGVSIATIGILVLLSTFFTAPACAQDPLSGCPAPAVSRFPTVAREEVIARAQAWVGSSLRYNQRGWSLIDPDTGRQYRQDCSGYVSLALHGSNCWTTVDLDKATTVAISKDELRPGDLINNKAPGNSGHVIIFERWDDTAHTQYWGYDFSTKGIRYRRVTYPFNGRAGFEPRRYKNVCSEDSRYIAQSGYPTVRPGEHFQIWFELENSGSCTWQADYNYSLTNINGTHLSASTSLPVLGVVAPGQRQRWTIDMVAPDVLGEYVTEWRMSHDGYLFGDAPWIRITVVAPYAGGDSSNEGGDAATLPEPAPAGATRYRVDPGNFVCGDIIGLEFIARRDERRIDFNVAKCDFSPIRTSGRLFIVADNGSQIGPSYYSAGDVILSGSFDPIGDLGLSGWHQWEVHVYPDGQNYPIESPSQAAWEVVE